jgi:hypothetical protein
MTDHFLTLALCFAPAVAPAPEPPAPSPGIVFTAACDCSCDKCECDPCACPPARPKAPAPKVEPPPARWRLTDASGQTWEYADPRYLTSFVEARNRSFVNYAHAPAPAARASRCYNGRCN